MCRYSTGSWIFPAEDVSEVVPSAFVTVVTPEGGLAAALVAGTAPLGVSPPHPAKNAKPLTKTMNRTIDMKQIPFNYSSIEPIKPSRIPDMMYHNRPSSENGTMRTELSR